MLIILLPITLETTISFLPLKAATKLVKSSGALVEKDTIVTPIKSVGTFK